MRRRGPSHIGRFVWTAGTVTVGGASIEYCAVAGTVVVHPKDWDDAAPAAVPPPRATPDDNPKNTAAAASMFYVAYSKRKTAATERPITFPV